VLRQRPNHDPALFGLARARLGLGQPAEARAIVRRVQKPGDRELLLVARSFFYEGRFDSAGAGVNRLVRTSPQSVWANDGLELALLAGAARQDSASLVELARAMMDLETGNLASGTARSMRLRQGGGVVAEAAALLEARLLLSQGQPGPALAKLDSFGLRFPSSALRPRARLEAAYLVRDVLNDDARFRGILESLVLEFPGATCVPIARSLLSETPVPARPGGIR
jgi:hypothetical protein